VGGSGGSGCTSDPKATTCNGKCGTVKDNCQVVVDCGTTQCTGVNTCGGGGTPNVCGCTPSTAADVCGSQICGTVSNGCGGTVSCGGCPGTRPMCCGDSCIAANQSCP
jgi:hypothetical protein